MKIVRPNYDDCITNLSNSILAYFGCKTFNKTLPDIDEILKENNSKNVVVLLLDGMGINILERTLSDSSFLRKNLLRAFHSIFPPTTVAATTSLMSGLNPCQHGLLGWDLYFCKENKTVTVFKNTIKDSNVPAAEYKMSSKYYPYTNIIEEINKKYEAYFVSPYGGIPYDNFNGLTDKVLELCEKTGKKFIYAYYEDPDMTTHEYGCDSREMKAVYKNLNSKVEALANKLEDTTLIVIADHGHINCEPINLFENEEFMSMLKRTTSIEPRACSFHLKSGMKDRFEQEFIDYENDFILYSKKQVIDKKIFGVGKEHKYFKDSLGDYLAIATSDKYFRDSENSTLLKSMHAGMTEDEMLIPLIVVTKK